MEKRLLAKTCLPLLGLFAAFLCSCGAGEAAPADKPVAFADTVFLETQGVKLGVSPSSGRIVHFGLPKGPNLLWLNKASEVEGAKAAAKPGVWINYGGDKVWPSQQANWKQTHGGNWPPDPAIDGTAWTLGECTKSKIVMKSPDVPNLGIRVVRTIEVKGDSASIVIRNRLERYAENPFPVLIWTISQVPLPPCALLDVWPKQPFPGSPFIEWYKGGTTKAISGGKALIFRSQADNSDSKVGALGSWMAAVYGSYAFLQSFDAKPGDCYPDRASLEIYANPYYMELETLGNERHLKPGESLETVVVWTLVPLAKDEDDMEKLAEKLASIASGN